MSSARNEYERGYVDGRDRAESERRDPTGLATVVSDLVVGPNYDNPTGSPAYSAGYREGRSDGKTKK